MVDKCVGESLTRRDALDKVRGAAKYVDDIDLPGMWHGAVVRTQIPHGKIKDVKLDPAFPWDEVCVADARDIPGRNCVAIIEEDLPLIITDEFKHIGEAVLLIAAPTREMALRARDHVKVSCRKLEPVLTIEDAKAMRSKIRGADNIFFKYKIECGDASKAIKKADLIVEGRYEVGHQEHAYIEPNGIIAAPRDGGGIEIVGSLQCPFYISKAMAILMNLPEDKISVRQATVGGAFGGKEDYPSLLAGYAAVLARKANRPVKIIYERDEDMSVTTKRHPAVVVHRSGVKRDGTILGMEISVEMEAGAYSTLTAVVLSRGLIHATGPYRCENVLANAVAYATNTPPNGAFRGFGAPQTIFAIERHMDRIALALGISPLEIRRKNMFKLGDVTSTGQRLTESVGATKCLDAVIASSDYKKRIVEIAKHNKSSQIKRGLGLSLYWHGAAFTGSGEAKIKAKAGLRLDPDGVIRLLVAATEMGQGAHTVLVQIVADAMGVGFSHIGVETPDTALVPNSGPTVASRTTLVVGSVLDKCARKMKAALQEFIGSEDSLPDDKLSNIVKRYLKERGPLTIVEQFQLPPNIVWDELNHKGDAYPGYSWGADVAEVEVDMTTLDVSMKKIWVACDIGRAINPKLVEGQIEGGTLQSVGYGAMESVIWNDGRLVTNRFQNYIIPTSLDAPEIETIIVEEPFSIGPFGAKGLGELPMNGGAPAIANAIAHATGLDPCSLPVTPEKLLKEMRISGNEK